MSLSIEQIEQQISELQKALEVMKNPKMEVVRHFTGQYFAPYQGRQYRRMESEGIPIWECYLDIKKEWVIVSAQELEKLEKIYFEDCIQTTTQESQQEIIEEEN
jgi:hypothetical protein